MTLSGKEHERQQAVRAPAATEQSLGGRGVQLREWQASKHSLKNPSKRQPVVVSSRYLCCRSALP